MAQDDAVVIVADRGEAVAVVIPPAQYERYRELVRKDFFHLMDEIGRRDADLDPDEVLCDVTRVVEEVRQERYDRARRD